MEFSVTSVHDMIRLDIYTATNSIQCRIPTASLIIGKME